MHIRVPRGDAREGTGGVGSGGRMMGLYYMCGWGPVKGAVYGG